MRLYRVHWHTDHGNSAGYSWFRARREAKAEMAMVISRDELTEETGDMPELEPFDLECNAAGLLSALRLYASHPDNG